MSDGKARKLKEIMKYSDIETKRFGFRIYRGVVNDVNEKAILSAILENGVDIAILRVPSQRQFQIPRLERIGFPYLVADTLVRYRVDLAKYEPKSLRNRNLDFVQCLPEHAAPLGILVKSIFANYTNHYFSNPLLDRKDILAAFEDWALRYIGSDNEGRICWLVKQGDEYVAFATCAFDENLCEGVLYGVKSSASGRGIYGDLIKFTQRYFKNKGYSAMSVSTQVQNLAVQRVWSREGFKLSNSFATVHINSLLSRSVIEKRVIDIKVAASDILNCGEFSGDMNPLHFDDDFAKDIGFEGRIVHGLVLSSAISKYYGTEFPGKGTIFMGYSYKFLKPVYPGRSYRLTISFPFIDFQKGIYRSLAKVTGEKNDICLLSYNDLYKKAK
ncbi:hypothetical protein CH330_00040 [candidate division WOR-3 bacterium JGI_Cruoil_03_51_56]|uniref:N-acetyltransferase domain-containing protein n=1 Tax=candidate division WOR-3 bacterium JGI_Cruoil_03_51_56 TaxID=1973747 RepID=A0A235C0Y0_UNCW3|nr:MAG: hypothetical protein CH330_00040 [candidate division WOR-3 bacterium JGI_Cruoil_03_51_56]